MLKLDTEDSIFNPAAGGAIKNERLGQLKKLFGKYFGFTTAAELANYFALSQVIGERAAAESGATSLGNRIPSSAASVNAARQDLRLRVDDSNLAKVLKILLDHNGQGGSNKILPTDKRNPGAILNQLGQLLVGTNEKDLYEKKHSIARCVKVHCSDRVTISDPVTKLKEDTDKILYTNLDAALPILQNENQYIKEKVAVIRAEHPLFVPGEKNAELLTIFFNGMPALEMTRATPVLNIKFYSSRQVFEEGKLAAITLQKFVEGAREVDDTAESLPLRAIGLASQVPTGSIEETRGAQRDNFQNYTITGLELFRAPQTLNNIEATKNTNNYLTPIIDPFRPLASIKSFNVDIKSSYGLQSTRTATLEIVLHDRSRMGEFADFIKPDRYGESFLEVEYGWLHPDSLGENPYADLLNLTRTIDHFTITTSNFNFDEVGQVNITLNLIGKGSAQITELSIIGEDAAGRIQTQIRQIQDLSETVNRLSNIVFPPPRENANGTTQRRAEFRGAQGLSAVGDATNNLYMSRDVLKSLKKLQNNLNNVSGSPSRRQAANDLKEAITRLVGDQTGIRRTEDLGAINASRIGQVRNTLNGEIRTILNGLNPNGRTVENHYGDTFLQTIATEPWEWIKENIDDPRPVPDRPQIPTGQLPSTNNNAASARSTNNQVPDFGDLKVVSLGTLITAFVGKPLASMQNSSLDSQSKPQSKFEEVQLYFYNFNNKAGIMSHCNISQFPVQTDYFTREYGRLRMENVSRTVNLSVSEFMNFISTKIVDDVLNPAYGINKLYKQKDDGDIEAQSAQHIRGIRNAPRGQANSFDEAMYNYMSTYNIGHHPDFVPPQITFDIEATQPLVDGAPQSGKSILKIHIYDKVCSPNTAYRELLTMGTNNVMGVLSAYPGSPRGREAVETQAIANNPRENIGVLRENWRALQDDLVQRSLSNGLIQPMTPIVSGSGANRVTIPQYRFVGGAQQLKEFVMKGVPHIIYGAMGSTIRSANVGAMSNPALNSMNMLRSLSASPIQPNGQQIGGLPLSVYPVEVSMTSLGCPFLRHNQELFIDYNTNTSIDNLYYVNGIQHKIEAGSFETSIKFIANDSFGQYRNLIGQLNTAEVTLNEVQRPTTLNANITTPTRTSS